jgi:DNA modification methylase
MIDIRQGDCLEVMKTIADKSINCCVTSPPYWCLRDYGVAGQMGMEETPEEYVTKMVSVFAEVRRVLRDDGTLWLNLWDSYASGGMGAGCLLYESPLWSRNWEMGTKSVFVHWGGYNSGLSTSCKDRYKMVA